MSGGEHVRARGLACFDRHDHQRGCPLLDVSEIGEATMHHSNRKTLERVDDVVDRVRVRRRAKRLFVMSSADWLSDAEEMAVLNYRAPRHVANNVLVAAMRLALSCCRVIDGSTTR